jgi:hypothetical protein
MCDRFRGDGLTDGNSWAQSASLHAVASPFLATQFPAGLQ